MDRRARIASKRRHIQQRAQDLLQRVVKMDDEELRWTVRVFADCLSAPQRAKCLGPYDERLPLETRRRLTTGFIRRYTRLALAALARSDAVRESGLASLTDEDLQGMSLADKCRRIANDPTGLTPDQFRRELARLFMCKSYDLFHDAGLSEAVVEYPAYHRARDVLETQSDAVVTDLVRVVVREAAHLHSDDPRETEAALGRIRDAISRRIGFAVPPQQLFAGQMARLPLDSAEQLADSGPRRHTRPVWEMPGGDLSIALLVVADLMTQREVEEHLLPLRRQFRSFTDIPGPELRALLSRIWTLLGDRRITDFAERYRSGRMVADTKVPPDVWALLPASERLALLERDNRAMELDQAVRHAAKIFFSFQYERLFDAGFHVDLLRSPHYHEVLRGLTRSQGTEGTRQLAVLTETLTRHMLELESLAPEARSARLQGIRALIAAALDLPDALTYPAPREGRA
jgi:hypothetical protein